jgi:hypothetical protein
MFRVVFSHILAVQDCIKKMYNYICNIYKNWDLSSVTVIMLISLKYKKNFMKSAISHDNLSRFFRCY